MAKRRKIMALKTNTSAAINRGIIKRNIRALELNMEMLEKLKKELPPKQRPLKKRDRPKTRNI